MKLYEITNDMRGLQALADNGDLSLGDIKDTMDALDIQFEQKAEAAIKVRQSMLANVANIEAEIDRLIDLKKAPENNAQRIGDYIKANMLALEKDKVDLGLFKLTLKKSTQKLGPIDESLVPEEFWAVVPETKKLDKRALLKAAKESSVKGVALTQSERALIIK